MKLFLLVWHSDWHVVWNQPRQSLDDSVRLWTCTGWAVSPAPACAGSSALSEMTLWIMNGSVAGPRMQVWSELGVSAFLWHLALCVCSGNFSRRWGETKRRGERSILPGEGWKAGDKWLAVDESKDGMSLCLMEEKRLRKRNRGRVSEKEREVKRRNERKGEKRGRETEWLRQMGKTGLKTKMLGFTWSKPTPSYSIMILFLCFSTYTFFKRATLWYCFPLISGRTCIYPQSVHKVWSHQSVSGNMMTSCHTASPSLKRLTNPLGHQMNTNSHDCATSVLTRTH